MSKRQYAPRCGECHQKTMVLATVPYDIQIDHDGKKYQVHIPELGVPKCTNCGEISIDNEAGEAIENAFRDIAGLLKPGQIRDWRTRLQLSQEKLSKHLGISSSTLSRWENGAQVQQESLDRLMRLFFGSEENRRMLGDHSRLATLGLVAEPAWSPAATAPVPSA